MKFIVITLLAFALLLSGCVTAPSEQKPANQTANSTQTPPASNGSTQMANPAAANCVQKGHQYEIRGSTGFCIFQSGRECEEWAYFRGECKDEAPAKKPGKLGEFCGGIAGFVCESNLECRLDGTYPDAGGKCYKKSVYAECKSARADACTTQYEPVCGRSGATESLYDYEDYANPCVACSKSSPALGYFAGTCEENGYFQKAKDPSVLYSCPSDRFDACTKEYDPVCGRMVGSTPEVAGYQDYANPCEACSKASNAIGYYVGTCAGKKS